MKKIIIILLLIVSFSCVCYAVKTIKRNRICVSIAGLPDSKCTTGAIRTTDIKSICTDKTSQFRPSVNYTQKLKLQSIADYGYKDTNPKDYEEDHLVPLEIGGAGSDPNNLWAEPRYGTNNSLDKDKFENMLHKLICNGTVTPQEAQKEFMDNWTLNYYARTH